MLNYINFEYSLLDSISDVSNFYRPGTNWWLTEIYNTGTHPNSGVFSCFANFSKFKGFKVGLSLHLSYGTFIQ